MNVCVDWSWLQAGFGAVLSAAVLALPLAAAVWAIDVGLRHRIAPRWRCWLWMLVAVRLLLPVAPASPLSWQNIWSPAARDAILPRSPSPSGLAAGPPAAVSATWWQFRPGHAADTVASVRSADGPLGWRDLAVRTVLLVWAIGVAIVGIRAAGASWRFARRLRGAPALNDARIAALLTAACTRLGTRVPRVKLVTGLPSPALFGAVRPALCLPHDLVGQLSDSELRLIFLHEVAHIRRGDVWQAWLVTAVQAVQWFNPVAWLAARRVAAVREMACDEFVRQFTEPSQRRGYADLLLRFAARAPAPALGIAGLAFARPTGGLAERIIAWNNAGAKCRVPAVVAPALLVVFALTGLTDAASPGPRTDNAATLPDYLAMTACEPTGTVSPYPPLVDNQAADDVPCEVRAYDVAQAAAKLAEVNGEQRPYEAILRYAMLPGLGVKSARYDEQDPTKLWGEMPACGHDRFGNLLKGLAESGGWQVVVASHCLTTPQLESLEGIDWQRAVRFTTPQDDGAASSRPNLAPATPAGDLAVSSKSISERFAPYLAARIDGEQRDRILAQLQADPRSSIRAYPKITLFNGTAATVAAESTRPFVTGVHYVKGSLAQAAQPDVAVLSEGIRLDVEPVVIDAETLDLACVLTSTAIDDVAQVRLPGQDVTVEAPSVHRQSIAARCRLAPGEALLIAPFAGQQPSAASSPPRQLYVISAEWFLDDGIDRHRTRD